MKEPVLRVASELERKHPWQQHHDEREATLAVCGTALLRYVEVNEIGSPAPDARRFWLQVEGNVWKVKSSAHLCKTLGEGN